MRLKWIGVGIRASIFGLGVVASANAGLPHPCFVRMQDRVYTITKTQRTADFYKDFKQYMHSPQFVSDTIHEDWNARRPASSAPQLTEKEHLAEFAHSTQERTKRMAGPEFEAFANIWIESHLNDPRFISDFRACLDAAYGDGLQVSEYASDAYTVYFRVAYRGATQSPVTVTEMTSASGQVVSGLTVGASLDAATMVAVARASSAPVTLRIVTTHGEASHTSSNKADDRRLVLTSTDPKNALSDLKKKVTNNLRPIRISSRLVALVRFELSVELQRDDRIRDVRFYRGNGASHSAWVTQQKVDGYHPVGHAKIGDDLYCDISVRVTN